MKLPTAMGYAVVALGIFGWQGTVLAKPPLQRGAGVTTAADFVKYASQRGIAELALSQLAIQRAQSPEVRRLARRMVDDYSNANDELTELVRQKSLEVPGEMDLEHRAIVARLSGISGAAFDHQYLDAMLKDHARDIALFRDYSQNGKDEELKAWAAKILPTVRKRQQLASTVAAAI